jgi:hypothetical protein
MATAQGIAAPRKGGAAIADRKRPVEVSCRLRLGRLVGTTSNNFLVWASRIC